MKTNEERVCCICGKKFKGYGNNPDPLRKEGVCCDECNKEVIEARAQAKWIDEIMETW